ncbi:hypothetical protein DLM77_18600 [Leptospira yasudae]|uniref:Uncharacterized protein n=1 Tax=Leptospira yasudae TaxID=2202201 RepID=A0ABX9LYZ1_9LEPT|nr:hypothetical protein DLM77_18600 [Leptospira yasudae]
MLDWTPRRLSRASSIHGLGSRLRRSLWVTCKRFHSKASNPSICFCLSDFIVKEEEMKLGREGFEPSKT